MSYLPACVLNADAMADYEWSNTFNGVVIKNLKTSDGKYNHFHVSNRSAGAGVFYGTFCNCVFLSKEIFNIAVYPYPVDCSSVCVDMFKNTVQTPDIVITAFDNSSNISNPKNVASNAFNDFLLNASENGRLFVPKGLTSVTCPDTWERYDI